mmetsp:Transcript_9575/g.20984  ORF Transcript_9575/g.20984 Transcript_9575/m.20984 type:complete len:210 (+) Transcript_9575:3031-3660(+)
MEADRRDVVRVPLQGLQTGLGLVVPDLHCAVVSAREQVGLVAAWVVIHTVDAFIVSARTVQREVGRGGGQAPHLEALVQRRRGEGVGVTGIDFDHHHVVAVTFKNPRTLEIPVPVPQFDRHVIGGGEDVGAGGVDLQEADVVRVRLPLMHLLHGVVVVHAHVHIIRASDDPVLAHDESSAADGVGAHLEALHQRVVGVIPNVHISAVEC